MENHLIKSSTYKEKTSKKILRRREELCWILNGNPKMASSEILKAMLSSGFHTSRGSIDREKAVLKAASDYMSGKLSVEEIRKEQNSYRKGIYSDLFFLIEDGIGPEKIRVGDESIKKEEPVSENTQAVDKNQETPDPLVLFGTGEKFLEAWTCFSEELKKLITENGQLRERILELVTAENREKELLKKIAEEKDQLRSTVSGLELKLKTQKVESLHQLKKIGKKYAECFQKSRSNAMFQIINQQGHENVLMRDEITRLEGVLKEESEKNLLLQGLLDEMEKAEKNLRDEIGYKDLEIEECEETIQKYIKKCGELEAETKKNGKQYVFPDFCKELNLPIVIGRDFIEFFDALPSAIKRKTIKALNLVAEKGFSYPSLESKQWHDGQRQIRVDISYRLFWEQEGEKVVLIKVVNKNAL